MKNLFTTEVSDIEKKIVFSAVFVLYAIFALVSSLSHIEYSPIPGFISICGVSTFIISLQTAFLLYNQSKISLDSANSLLSS